MLKMPFNPAGYFMTTWARLRKGAIEPKTGGETCCFLKETELQFSASVTLVRTLGVAVQ